MTNFPQDYSIKWICEDTVPLASGIKTPGASPLPLVDFSSLESGAFLQQSEPMVFM